MTAIYWRTRRLAPLIVVHWPMDSGGALMTNIFSNLRKSSIGKTLSALCAATCLQQSCIIEEVLKLQFILCRAPMESK